MSVVPPVRARSAPLVAARSPRRRALLLGAAVVWTWFVWVTRIRNALDDDALGGASLAGVVALSASFLLLSAAVAVLALRGARGGRPPTRTSPLGRTVAVTALWSALVWAVRVVDIAFVDDGSVVWLGGHDPAFVVVHAVIGVLSVTLWAASYLSLTEPGSE